MKDSILLNKIWIEVSQGNVSASTSGSLTVFKYTQQCIVEDNWNEVTRQCRGIIFASNGTIVARPFSKFFNLGERDEKLPKESFEVYEKMDGSCGIGYQAARQPLGEERPAFVDGICARYLSKWFLATPGSMESDQAIEGTRMLHEYEEYDEGDGYLCEKIIRTNRYNLAALPQDCTPVFEIIYASNRIVVDYNGESFLSLLAIFDHDGVEWHPSRVDQISEACGFSRPKRFKFETIEELLEYKFPSNFEGFVVRFESGYRVKIKSQEYVRIHRLLDYLSPKRVVELIRGKKYGTILEGLPKEIQEDFDDIRATVQQQHDFLYGQACAGLTGATGLATRKEQARWIQMNVEKEIRGLVFGLLDQKDIEDGIWKVVLAGLKNERTEA